MFLGCKILSLFLVEIGLQCTVCPRQDRHTSTDVIFTYDANVWVEETEVVRIFFLQDSIVFMFSRYSAQDEEKSNSRCVQSVFKSMNAFMKASNGTHKNVCKCTVV